MRSAAVLLIADVSKTVVFGMWSWRRILQILRRTAHVECVELLYVSSVRCPRFAAVHERG